MPSNIITAISDMVIPSEADLRLFQNRYKSIICQEDAYFQELLRYIHLNPIRADIVPDIIKLDGYPWCRHAVIMRRRKHDWLDRNYVLRWSGKNDTESKNNYRCYVQEGVPLGSRPELGGEGLIRSLGSWSTVIFIRRHGQRDESDERILGNGNFVEKILKKAYDLIKKQLPENSQQKIIVRIMQGICDKREVNIKEIVSGSLCRFVSEAQRIIACRLVKDHGIPLPEVARHNGVSTSAVSKMIGNEVM